MPSILLLSVSRLDILVFWDSMVAWRLDACSSRLLFA
jgi:hypothetical protein